MKLNDVYRVGYDIGGTTLAQWRWTWSYARAERWVARLNRRYPGMGWRVLPLHLFKAGADGE